MKIAYLSTFYPYRGGIAQFNAALYRAFEKNHDVRAYTFLRQYPEIIFPGKSQMVGQGDTADPIPSIKVLDSVNPVGYYRASRKIRGFAPDLLVSKFWMPFFAPSLGYVAKSLEASGTVNISILDNVIPHEKRPGDIKLTKYYLNHNHGFIVMSETVKNDLLSLKPAAAFESHPHPLYDHFGEKPDKLSARERLGIGIDKNVLLFFGFIRDYKGLDILLEAMARLGEHYVLVIAGESYGSFDKYDEIIKKNKLGDRVVRHVRYISDGEVPDYFSAADVCVLPYKSATQSGIVGIAYHFGLPIIATDTGSLREMIEPYGTGIMVKEADPAQLKDAIEMYFSGHNEEAMASNIMAYKDKYNWESLALTIEKLYERIKSGQ